MFDSDSPHRLRHVPAAARLLRRAPRRRLGIAASSALALGLLMTTAAAQPTEAPAPPTDDEASSPALSQATVDGPLWVDVDAAAYAVDEDAVRIAVAQELGATISDSEAGARARAGVRVDAGGNMEVHFDDSQGRRVRRTVNAPRDPDEVPAVAALLLGNLARDQITALLDSLEPAPTAEDGDARATLAETQPEASVEPAHAEAADVPSPSEPSPLRSAPVNLALFYPLSITPEPLEHRFVVDLSLLYGRVGGIDAFAVSGGVFQVDRSSYGLQAAGVGNVNHGHGAGVRAGGAFDYRKGEFTGLEVAGAVVIAEGAVRGLQSAGAVTHQEGDFDGLQASGAVGVSKGDSYGLMLAGGVHLQQGTATGLQAAGALSLSSERLQGMQLAAVNVSGDVDGAQFGIVNVGRRVHGLQLGVVNVADEVDGASIGLVTYSKQGKTQAVAWYDTERPANVGVRFYTGPLYAMPTFGYRRHGGKDEYAPGLSLGGRVPFADFFADLDVNASTPAAEMDFDEHQWELRYRALLGWQVLPFAAVFVGGGVRHAFDTKSGGDEDWTPIANLGVQLF